MENYKKVCNAPPKLLRDCNSCGPVIVTTYPDIPTLLRRRGLCGELGAVCDELYLYDCCSNSWINVNKDILPGNNISIQEDDTTITINAVVGEEGINVVSCGPEASDGNLVQNVDSETSVITLRELREGPGIDITRDPDNCGINISAVVGEGGINVESCGPDTLQEGSETRYTNAGLVSDVDPVTQTITLRRLEAGRHMILGLDPDNCDIIVNNDQFVLPCGFITGTIPPDDETLVVNPADDERIVQIKNLRGGDGITLSEPDPCTVEISLDSQNAFTFFRGLATTGETVDDPTITMITLPHNIPENAIAPKLSATGGGGGGGAGANSDGDGGSGGGGGGAGGAQIVRLDVSPLDIIGGTLGLGGAGGVGATASTGDSGDIGGFTDVTVNNIDAPVFTTRLGGGGGGGGGTAALGGIGGTGGIGTGPNTTVLWTLPEIYKGPDGGAGGDGVTPAQIGGAVAIFRPGGLGGGSSGGGGGGASVISTGLDGGSINQTGFSYPRAGATGMAEIGFGAGGGGGGANNNGGRGGDGAILIEYWLPA